MKPGPRILSVTSSTHAPAIVTPSAVWFSPPEVKLMKPPSLRLCNAELNELLFFDCTSAVVIFIAEENSLKHLPPGIRSV